MSDFERIYKDGVPTEKNVCIEKHFSIEHHIDKYIKEAVDEYVDSALKEMERPIEESKTESPKRKPKRVPSKSNKATVARVQKKLPKRLG